MLTGHAALIADLGLEVPTPFTQSQIAGTIRKSEVHADRCLETFPKKHLHAGGFRDHLLFALKNEPTDLGVLHAAFKKTGPRPVRDWVLAEPSGSYSRRAWFLYEFLTGDIIDLPTAKKGNHADVLNQKHHIVAEKQTSTRHRLYDNLLGVPGFCLTVRRTQKLTGRMAMALNKEVIALTKTVDPELLRRAVSYLHTKETRSTFEIEGETATPKHEQRFVAALSEAAKFDLSDKAQLVALQNAIVEPRYAAKDWRDIQNYVGQTAKGFRQVVDLVCPKPEDVPNLMAAWTKMSQRLLTAGVDAAIAAALVAFPFVFVHPFEDGNGRIHRFLIHNVLAKTGFSPDGIIFPVSSAIVRDMRTYDAALEHFSRPLLSLIDWKLVPPDDKMIVDGQTDHLYRYFDATPQAEFLYDKIAETIHKDLMEELEFLGAYDKAYSGVRAVVDMPNKKLSLFVRLTMQNDGKLPKGRRKLFAELTNKEVETMEAAVHAALQHARAKDEAEAVD
jgi:hypothetical protein